MTAPIMTRILAALVLAAFLMSVPGGRPAGAGELSGSSEVKRPASEKTSPHSKSPPGYPKGGLSAADARKGFKPSVGAKPYRYFGRHGYGKSGISRFGQGSKRH